MSTMTKHREYYAALLARSADYEGIFFVGIKTTGIFCRPTCPARKPKFANCDFFASAQDSLLAGYRPCKRCHPMSPPGHASLLIQTLVDAVEAQPEKRWKDRDFHALGVDVSTVRRQFKQRFGMTFVAYARARRMGLALHSIRQGKSIIGAQVDAGYESGSGFRDAFSRIMGVRPNTKNLRVLKAAWLDTPLGPMLAIADDEVLYLLEFTSRRGLEREVERMRKKLNLAIIPGRTTIINAIEKELSDYFSGRLKHFKTPLHLEGSVFEQSVWRALIDTPFGQTRSYADQSQAIGNPNAHRAVGRANGSNQLAIVIPCHRVINADGQLGGYGGGLARKQWLLDHEQNVNHPPPPRPPTPPHAPRLRSKQVASSK